MRLFSAFTIFVIREKGTLSGATAPTVRKRDLFYLIAIMDASKRD